MSYHVTTDLTKAQIDLFTLQAEKQDEKILAFFRANPRMDFSPSDVWRMAFDIQRVPITSVRRAITELTDAGFLVKVENVIKTGTYGRPEHLWRLK